MPLNSSDPRTKQPPEVEIVTHTRVSCDGGEGGHPLVWLSIDDETGWVECGYCDKRFILQRD